MILVITPYLHDFRRMCIQHRIECTFNFNGMPSNPNVRWIRDIDNLIGLKIKEEDTIIYGADAPKFSDQQIELIQNEINIRKKAT